MGKDSRTEQKIIRAIRAKCLDCCGGAKKEVALCVLPHCPLYRYRLGEQQAQNTLPTARYIKSLGIQPDKLDRVFAKRKAPKVLPFEAPKKAIGT